jgi:carboxypeptidase family protein
LHPPFIQRGLRWVCVFYRNGEVTVKSTFAGFCTRALAALLLALGVAAGAAAQETTGTITGVAKDSSGAVLPGVTVTVKNVQTGGTQEFVTNESGIYTARLLQPGEYEVAFALSGFQSRTIKGIQLHVNDRLEVNGQLGVTGVSETVEVSAASQFVQPSPSVQNLMGPTQVQELPLNNRNFVQLATLVPGVSSDLSDEVGIGLTSTVSISVAGGRRNAVNWLVDGVSNVDVGSNITLLSTPTLESIQEFKIITSSYAAEFPRSGGGVVNIVTKGGSQKFSGTAYDFIRNNSLNANTFFRNRSTDASLRDSAPRLRYQNPGYTVGGPILPSRQKAFFFWSQEWRRISRAVSNSTVNVVDPAWLSDPANANYVDPAQRDPNSVKLLALWPTPNATSGTGVAQYVNTVPSINNTRQEVVRADVDVNPRYKLVGRYTHDLSDTVEPGGLFQSQTAFLPHVSATNTGVPGQVMAIELRGTYGGMLNELKYQFSSNRIHTTDDGDNRNTRSDLGISTPELFPENAAGRIPSVSISGLQGFTTIQAFNIEYFNNTIADNLTWQRGKHALKVGGLMAFERKNENANNNTQGSFAFVAGGGRTAFQNFLTGNRDSLCGAGCTYSEAEIDVTNHLRFQRYEIFAQDTFRMRPNVTLDYGIRYALYPAVTDANNILSTFDPTRFDPAKAPTCANAACSAVIPGTGDPLNGLIVAGQNSPFGDAIYATEKNNWQPRAGISWDPSGDGKAIVRGGFGLYFDQPLVGIFEQNAFTNPPYVNTVSVTNASMSNPSAGSLPGTSGLRSLIASSVPFKTPRMQQWNVGYQRQVYRRGSIDVGYVGSHGDHQIQPVDINRPDPSAVVAAGSQTAASLFRGYNVSTSNTGAGINNRQTTAYSNYHGLLTQFRHEGGRGGTYTLNYTLSRARTTATNDRDAADLPQNPRDLDAEYADARTDRRHIFNATYIIELPFYKDANAALKAALGGWQLSGYTTLQSGPPVSRILQSTNNDRRGIFADQVGNPRAGTMDFPFWFDPAAFAPSADGTYGSSRRAIFRLPGRNQTDLALSKNFYMLEGKRLQFRADFLNAFNHTQWSVVDNTCDTSLTTCGISTDTFGQITAARNPREIQLSLKLFW